MQVKTMSLSFQSFYFSSMHSTLFVMAQLRAQEIFTNKDVVSELIHKSFFARGVAEQRLIVQQN